MEKQKLKERPTAVRVLPRGLGAHKSVAVVTVTNTALPADWCEDMERRLEDIKFFNEAALV